MKYRPIFDDIFFISDDLLRQATLREPIPGINDHRSMEKVDILFCEMARELLEYRVRFGNIIQESGGEVDG